MKVIFLDIDGVLNLIPQGYDKYGGIFHIGFVDNLKTIIDQTDAKIVISSTWRLSGLQTMKDMWLFRNLPGEVIDITPSGYFNVDLGVSDDDYVTRGHEIRYWLKNHPEVSNYVILDDDTDFLDSQMDNFVQTSDNIDHPDCIDVGYGLTKICTLKAINILNNENKN
jgi:hypothetical protein